MNFTDSTNVIMAALADATANVGAVSFPCAFNTPNKQLQVHDMGVMSTDPSLVAASDEVEAAEIENGTFLTVSPWYGGTAADYEVTNVAPDGKGLTVVSLVNA